MRVFNIKTATASLLACLALFTLLWATQAEAAFRPSIDITTDNTDAGGHPNLSMRVRARAGDERLDRMELTMPQGFVGNPYAVQRCPANSADCGLVNGGRSRVGNLMAVAVVPAVLAANSDCPPDLAEDNRVCVNGDIYLQEPSVANRADPAALQFLIRNPPRALNNGANFTIPGRVRLQEVSPGDYRVVTQVRDIINLVEIREMRIELNGRAGADPSNPFLTNPTRCVQGQITTTFTAADNARTRWTDPSSYPDNGPITNCQRQPFSPSLSIELSSNFNWQPVGLRTTVEQDLGQSHLKKTTVKIPPGFTVNSTLDNVGVCDKQQVKLCDEEDAIGEVTATSPVLSGAPDAGDRSLTGPAFLMMRDPDAPPTEPLRLGVYLTHPTFDLEFQIYGTMQMRRNADGEFFIEAVFDNLPQVPISSFDLDIDQRLIKNPPWCGQEPFIAGYLDHNDRSRSSNTSPLIRCNLVREAAPFAPTFGVQTTSNLAGANPNLTFNISRGQGEQTFEKMEISMPPGLAGNPQAVVKCTYQQARTDTCPHNRGIAGPSGSKIGEVTARTQVFGFLDPLEIKGNVYMGDPETMDVPYRDDPGVMFVILDLPQIAGGGTLLLIVRMQLRSSDYGIDATIAGLPTEFDVRRISMTIFGGAGDGRTKVLTNPTSCGNDKRFIARFTGNEYVPDRQIDPRPRAAVPYEVQGCDRLGFSPRLSTRLLDMRSHEPSRLRTVITQDEGEAHLRRARINFPRGVRVNSLLDGVERCTQAEVDNWRPEEWGCDDKEGSVIATVRADSPLLERGEMLTGTAHLKETPLDKPMEMVIYLKGLVDLKLEGKLQAFRENSGSFRIKAAFDSLPELPVTYFELSMSKKLLLNPATCGSHTFEGQFDGHNDANRLDNSQTRVHMCDRPRDWAPFSPSLDFTSSDYTAGAHPQTVKTVFDKPKGHQAMSSVRLALPRGMAGNPNAAVKCSEAQANINRCPQGSLIGSVTASTRIFEFLGENLAVDGKLYMTGPLREGDPGGAYLVLDLPEIVGGWQMVLEVRLVLNDDNRIEAIVTGLPTEFDIRQVVMRLNGRTGENVGKPLITNPTSCDEGKTANAGFTGDDFGSHGATAPYRVRDCERLGFSPRLAVTVDPTRGGVPTKLKTTVTLGRDEAHLRQAQIKFPRGFRVNSKLAGLYRCSQAQINEWRQAGRGCDDDAETVIGTSRAESPLLEDGDTLSGTVHLKDTPLDRPTVLVVFLKGLVDVKVEGKVLARRDAAGNFRLEADFNNMPELPVTRFEMDLEEKLVINPTECGQKTFEGEFHGYHRDGAAVGGASSVAIDSCDRIGTLAAFGPKLGFAPSSYIAGDHPDLTISVDKPAGQQPVRNMKFSLPTGFMGNPQSASPCAAQDADAGRCPPGTKLGDIEARVQVFGFLDPLTVSGEVFMAPRESDPARMHAVLNLPEVAGGGRLRLLTRVSLREADKGVDAQVVDMPTDLDIRQIKLKLFGRTGEHAGRPFLTNSTFCTPNPASAVFTSEHGVASTSEAHYQATGCERLGFNPKLGVSLDPATPDTTPAIKTVVTQEPGEATLAEADVRFPKELKLNIAKVPPLCSQELLAIGACSESSRLGSAVAYSPLLADSEPLSGPVYMTTGGLGSNIRIVAQLRGLVNIDLPVDAAVNPLGGLNAKVSAPSVPVSRFEMTLEGGGKGMLRTASVCKRLTFAAGFKSHSGKTSNSTSNVTLNPCKTSLRASVKRPKRGRRSSLSLSLSSGYQVKDATVALGKLRLSKRWPKRWNPGKIDVEADEGKPISSKITLGDKKRKRLSGKRKSKKAWISKKRKGPNNKRRAAKSRLLKVSKKLKVNVKLVRKKKRAYLRVSAKRPFTKMKLRLRSKGPIVEPKLWRCMTFKGKVTTSEGRRINTKYTVKTSIKNSRKKGKKKSGKKASVSKKKRAGKKKRTGCAKKKSNTKKGPKKKGKGGKRG